MNLDEFAAKSELYDPDDFYPATTGSPCIKAVCTGFLLQPTRPLSYTTKICSGKSGLIRSPPRTLDELVHAADLLTKRDENGKIVRLGYDAAGSGLWVWGHVFGGFFDEENAVFTINSPENIKAPGW